MFGQSALRSGGSPASVTEALLGQIYLVTVVATIVARVAPRRVAADD
jgi:Ca2+/Na+ antiporter